MHSASKIFSLSSLSCPSQSFSHIAVPAPILPIPIINLRFNRSRIYAKIYVMLRWCDCLITLSWKCDKLYVLMPYCSITHILRIFILPSFVVHLKVLCKLQIWSWKCKSCSRSVWMPQIYTAVLVSVLVFFCLVLIIGKPSNGVLHRLCLGRPSHSGIERVESVHGREPVRHWESVRVCAPGGDSSSDGADSNLSNITSSLGVKSQKSQTVCLFLTVLFAQFRVHGQTGRQGQISSR